MISYEDLRSIHEKIDSMRDLAEELLIDMIRIPTVSPSGEYYNDFINFASERLLREGFDVEILDVPQNLVDEKVPAEGRGRRRRIIIASIGDKSNIILHFNGHYDVVPGGPGWSITDPFKPVKINGRIYGRGATDMKGGIVSSIISMIALRDYADRNRLGLEIALVPDEEIGGYTGTEYLVSIGRVRGRHVIISEPSGLNQIYIGHKGTVWGRVIVRGRTAHASTPWLGVNAFEKMVMLAGEMFRRIVPETFSIKSRYEYDVPEGNTATIMIGGFLKGGEKTNQVPGEVVFSFDRRVIIEEKASEVWENLRSKILSIAKEIGVEAEVVLEQISEPVIVDLKSPVVRALERASEEVLGSMARKVVCIGGLDMRYYARAGYDVATYGPGVLGTAHAPDEYIEVGDIIRASKIYVNTFFNLLEKQEQ
ncbi:MAG: M20 family metallopeptidase [Sulfolobales archaeon]